MVFDSFNQQAKATKKVNIMTNKKFAVVGVSTFGGKTKIRFANDSMRVKILAKNGHTDIDLVNLPNEMSKSEIAQHLIQTDFAKGRANVADAVAYIAEPASVANTVEESVA
jgi:hypothetical protein